MHLLFVPIFLPQTWASSLYYPEYTWNPAFPNHSAEQSTHNDTQTRTPSEATEPIFCPRGQMGNPTTPPPLPPPSLQEAGDMKLHVSLQLFVVKMPPLKTAQVKGVHAKDVPEDRNLCDSSFKDRGCDTRMRSTLGHSRFYSHFLLMVHVNYLFFGVRTNLSSYQYFITVNCLIFYNVASCTQ